MVNSRTPMLVVLAIVAHLVLQMLFVSPLLHLAPLLAMALILGVSGEDVKAHPVAASRSMVLALACFFLSFALSLAMSIDRGESLQAFLALLPGPLVFAMVMAIPDARTLKQQLFPAICLASLAGALYLLSGFLTGDGFSPGFVMLNRYSAAFVVPNDVLLLTCLLPFAVFVLSDDPRTPARVIAAGSILLTIAAVVLAASRAGLLLLLLIAAAYAVQSSRRSLLLVGVGLLLALVAADAAQEFRFLDKLLATQTLSTRVVLWWAGLETFLQFPAFGQGPGTFDLAYAGALAESDPPGHWSVDRRQISWAHSLYIEALAERGLVGLVALIAPFAVGLMRGFAGLKASQWRPDSWLSPICISMLALLAAGAVELTLLRTWVVTLSFLLLGLATLPAVHPPLADQPDLRPRR